MARADRKERKEGKRRARVAVDSSGFVATDEALRVVRANLRVALSNLPSSTVIVTSANAQEGKTAICANLARSFAEAGKRVVLVDLDLRHPNAHLEIHTHNEFGVTDVLLGRRNLEDCLQYVELPTVARANAGLYFLGTGEPVHNPAELLGIGRTARMLDTLAAQADLVLIDTPPVLPVADTLVIGRMVAGAVLVVEARRTPLPAVKSAKDRLTRNQTRLLGVILNKVSDDDYDYGYGYGYNYAYPPENGTNGDG